MVLTETVPYQWYREGHFTDLELISCRGPWQVWAAQESQAYLLLVVNGLEKIVIKCQYLSWQHRCEDIALLGRIPPDGDAAAGVPAPHTPAPPVLSAGQARPFPPSGRGSRPPGD